MEKILNFELPKDVYDFIYERLLKLCPDLLSLGIGDYRKSSVPGFMDLNLDILDKNEKEMRIALSHYFRHPSGDMIADCDMEIRVYLSPTWMKAEALTYQDQFGYQTVYTVEDSRTLVNVNRKNELNGFLKKWLGNCLTQSHNLSRRK